MVMSEIEANLTSPSFVNRFIESNRRVLEADFCLIIKNIVAAEGTERIVRHISLNVWRRYFACFALMEADLSCVGVSSRTVGWEL